MAPKAMLGIGAMLCWTFSSRLLGEDLRLLTVQLAITAYVLFLFFWHQLAWVEDGRLHLAHRWLHLRFWHKSVPIRSQLATHLRGGAWPTYTIGVHDNGRLIHSIGRWIGLDMVSAQWFKALLDQRLQAARATLPPVSSSSP